MIRSVIFTDAGVYTCTNEQFSNGVPATVNVTITMDITMDTNNNCTYGVCMFGVYMLIIRV